MEKIFIRNRKSQNIAVLLEFHPAQKGLAFIMHGLTGFKEQPPIHMIAEAFYEKGYTVVRFDTTNTLGESDGDAGDATVTNYLEDLEDVITWAGTQTWYQEPFVLAGHSLGSMAIALYAQHSPQKVYALAPLATVVSGALSSQGNEEEYRKWKEQGYKIKESSSKPGVTTKIKWSHIENRMKYDLLKEAKALTMPILMIVGDQDTRTPPEHQELLFNELPGRKELHIIKQCAHTFKERRHLNQVKRLLLSWLDSL